MVKRRKDSTGVVLKDGEYQRSNGTYEFKWQDKIGRRKSIYAKTLKDLRENHISADKDHLDRSLKAQFKYSNKINAKYTIVIGYDELDKDKATLKNMETGDQKLIKISELVNELRSVL